MATVPHAITGWWRYSRIDGRRLAGYLMAFIVGLGDSVRPGWLQIFGVVLVALAAAVLVFTVVRGAVNAERARRYGCW